MPQRKGKAVEIKFRPSYSFEDWVSRYLYHIAMIALLVCGYFLVKAYVDGVKDSYRWSGTSTAYVKSNQTLKT